MNWNPQGTRRAGRPKATWKQAWKETVVNEAIAASKALAKNQIRWRQFVEELIMIQIKMMMETGELIVRCFTSEKPNFKGFNSMHL